MNRRVFLLSASSFVALGASGQQAHASVEDSVAGRLRREGYRITRRRRTWLGRIRITAVRNHEEREVVLDPTTGEILRDYIQIDDPDNGWQDSNLHRGGSGSNGGSSQPGGDEAAAPDDADGPSSGGESSGDGGTASSETDRAAEETASDRVEADAAAEREARERAADARERAAEEREQAEREAAADA